MIDNINVQANDNLLDALDNKELNDRNITQNLSNDTRNPFSNLAQIFNKITSDALTAISINDVNISNTVNVAPAAVSSNDTSANSISTDGKLSSPAILPTPTLELDDNGVVETIQIKDDTNTIRIGSLAFKEKP